LVLGLNGFITDNFDDLSKIELTDTKQYGDSLTQRTFSKKITAYKGEYEIQIIGAKAYANFYWVLLNEHTALHLNPEVVFLQDHHPQYNSILGLTYSFIDEKDDKEKKRLNIELYCKFSDFSNIHQSDLLWYNRNEIGLKIAVPVSFFNL
jgi:hypothetical protein